MQTGLPPHSWVTANNQTPHQGYLRWWTFINHNESLRLASCHKSGLRIQQLTGRNKGMSEGSKYTAVPPQNSLWMNPNQITLVVNDPSWLLLKFRTKLQWGYNVTRLPTLITEWHHPWIFYFYAGLLSYTNYQTITEINQYINLLNLMYLKFFLQPFSPQIIKIGNS